MSDVALFDFPYTPTLERRVRSRDADTSWDAAHITPTENDTVRGLVLTILRAARTPLTDDQIFERYRNGGGRRTPQRIRTARAELSNPKLGDALVVEFNVVGISDLGNKARRWELA